MRKRQHPQPDCIARWKSDYGNYYRFMKPDIESNPACYLSLLHKGCPPPATELNRSIKYPLPPTRHDTASHTECVAIRLGAGYPCRSFDRLNSVAGGGNPYSSISQGDRR
jgi:hypothetical protein